MLPPWFERRRSLGAAPPDARHAALEPRGIDVLLRPLSSAERRDSRISEATARPRAAKDLLAPGRYCMLAARNGWLPWLDRMLVRRCVAHLRDAAGLETRLLCRIDPDSLSNAAFVAELVTFAAKSPALTTRLAVALGRTQLPAPAKDVVAYLRDRGIAAAFRRIARHRAAPGELRRLEFDIVQLELDADARVPSRSRFDAAGLLLVVGHADIGPVLGLYDVQPSAA